MFRRETFRLAEMLRTVLRSERQAVAFHQLRMVTPPGTKVSGCKWLDLQGVHGQNFGAGLARDCHRRDGALRQNPYRDPVSRSRSRRRSKSGMTDRSIRQYAGEWSRCLRWQSSWATT